MNLRPGTSLRRTCLPFTSDLPAPDSTKVSREPRRSSGVGSGLVASGGTRGTIFLEVGLGSEVSSFRECQAVEDCGARSQRASRARPLGSLDVKGRPSRDSARASSACLVRPRRPSTSGWRSPDAPAAAPTEGPCDGDPPPVCDVYSSASSRLQCRIRRSHPSPGGGRHFGRAKGLWVEPADTDGVRGGPESWRVQISPPLEANSRGKGLMCARTRQR